MTISHIHSGLTVARFILVCIKYYICKHNYSRHADLQTLQN